MNGLRKKQNETPAGVMRYLLILMLSVCLIAGRMALTAHAAPQLLVDEAGNLSSSEARELNDLLNEVSDSHDMDVVVVIIESLNGKDAQAYADDFYDYNGYADDGALFLLSVGDSEYAFSTLGYGAEALTDAALDMIEDDVVSELKRGKSSQDYYDAYVAFAEGVDKYVTMADRGEPFEYELEERDESLHGLTAVKNNLFGNVVSSAIAGVVGSSLYMGRKKSKLRSVHRQRGAAVYVTGNGPRLSISTDQFVNRTVNKTPIPKKEPSRSGRGGTSYHTSSSGRSHGGRSGKF